jgi:uncharacterized protein (TIGR00369 family)
MELPPPGDTPFEAFLLKGVPHAEALGMMLVEVGDGYGITKMPYAAHLAGNPETGVVHGGVITSLLDHSCGIAVQSRVRSFGGIATLDLRIDYMKPATAGEDIYAFVECYRVTKSIAFVRGVAYHGDRNDPIAAVTAAFMLNTSEARKPS